MVAPQIIAKEGEISERGQKRNPLRRYGLKVESAIRVLGAVSAFALAGCANPAVDQEMPVAARLPLEKLSSSLKPSRFPFFAQRFMGDLVKDLESADTPDKKQRILGQISVAASKGQLIGEYNLTPTLIEVLESSTGDFFTDKRLHNSASAVLYHSSRNGESVAEAAPALVKTALEGTGFADKTLGQLVKNGKDISTVIPMLAGAVDDAAAAERAFYASKNGIRTHIGIDGLMNWQHTKDSALRMLYSIVDNGGLIDDAEPILKRHLYSFNANTHSEMSGILARHYLNAGNVKDLNELLKANPGREVIRVFFDAKAEQRAAALAILKPLSKDWIPNRVDLQETVALFVFHCVETGDRAAFDRINLPSMDRGIQEGLRRASARGYRNEVEQFVSRQR